MLGGQPSTGGRAEFQTTQPPTQSRLVETRDPLEPPPWPPALSASRSRVGSGPWFSSSSGGAALNN